MVLPTRAVIENAERLLKDAEILAAAGSYRTAISLAVLSLEESGKACLIRWKREGHIKRSIDREIRSGHIDKHLIFSAYRTVMALFSVGKIVKRGEDDTPIDPAFVKVIAEALHDKARIPKGTVETGLLDHFKQDGFYYRPGRKPRSYSAEPSTRWRMVWDGCRIRARSFGNGSGGLIHT